jgi:predicted RNase H-like HicB family nuclease
MIKPTHPIEVSITTTPKGFKATSDMFPDCVGRGKTEQSALKSLSKSIGNAIAKMVQGVIGDIFTSKNYTDIMTDPIKTPDKKIRYYNKASKSMSNMSLNQLLEINRGNLSADIDEFDIPDFNIDVVQPNELSHPNTDGILFGFPINLN